MENLSALIKSLSPGESTLIRHFYKLRNFGEYRKRVQLFDIIAKCKARNEIELAKLLGYTVPTASYHNLKSRLKSDIVCILLLQDSSSKFSTPYAQASFSCRRALLTGELLISRGVYHEGLSILKKAARVAEKFELFAERIIAEDILRNHHAALNSSTELEEGNEIIESNYRMLGNVMKSKKRLYETAFNEHSRSLSNDNDYNLVIEELNLLESQSPSSRVKFYSQLSKLNIFNNTGELPRAIECARELLVSMEKDPVIMSKSNQAGIELEIANMYLRAHDFPNAAEHSQKAALLFKTGMLNQVRALTILFYSQVHLGMYDKAQITLNRTLSSRCIKEKMNNVLLSRLSLLQAWFCFAKGEIDNATVSLRSCSDMAKEKGPWHLGFSILEVLIMIEKRSFDLASYKLEALRKMVSRTSNETYVGRTSTIIAVLRNIIRLECNFNALIKSNQKEFQLLKNDEPGYEWDPTGFELIRVDEWILMKSRK